MQDPKKHKIYDIDELIKVFESGQYADFKDILRSVIWAVKNVRDDMDRFYDEHRGYDP